MKPFNLEEAKAGEPVCTREGKPVRLVCFDVNNGNYPLLGLVQDPIDEEEYCISYTALGKNYIDSDNDPHDLFMVSEIKEGWINIYKDINDKYISGSGVYSSREQAISSGKAQPFTTIKITWEE